MAQRQLLHKLYLKIRLKKNLSTHFNSGVASNQPLHNTNGASVEQLVSLTRDLPVSLEDTLNQTVQNTAFPSVHSADQQSMKLPSCPNLNDGVKSNQLAFNVTVGSSQTTNSGSQQKLSNISVGSYQQMANPSVATNQQIPYLCSTQLMFNTAATQRGPMPTFSIHPASI